ncbi:hypothetical protein AB0F92_41875 [Kitasatospora aureofaciens]|uniref:hypothetical protein n=1 Tax=Kitasatospora aureofaciens TaxID=1894 RepID=UPI0033D7651D
MGGRVEPGTDPERQADLPQARADPKAIGERDETKGYHEEEIHRVIILGTVATDNSRH